MAPFFPVTAPLRDAPRSQGPGKAGLGQASSGCEPFGTAQTGPTGATVRRGASGNTRGPGRVAQSMTELSAPSQPTADRPTDGTTRLGVDIWLDVACPWCLVGERRFDKVLQELPFKDNVDVRFHSFQLDPNAPERSTLTQPEYLLGRGMDPERLRGAQEHLRAMGSELGIRFDEDSAVPSNTFTAHRLIQASAGAGAGVQARVVDALFSAYFEQGKDVGDAAQLRDVVVSAGLPAELADAVLADPTSFRAEVAEDIAQASRLGISGVPFYVIDNRYGVSGAQPEDTFAQALTQVFDELNPAPKLSPLTGVVGQDGATCGPEGC